MRDVGEQRFGEGEVKERENRHRFAGHFLASQSARCGRSVSIFIQNGSGLPLILTPYLTPYTQLSTLGMRTKPALRVQHSVLSRVRRRFTGIIRISRQETIHDSFRSIRCTAFVTVVCLLLLSARVLNAGDRRAALQRAIDEYSSAMETKDRDARLLKFGRAEQLFRQAIESDGDGLAAGSSELFVNLGNAALQAERLGPAIAAYRNALRLNPRDAQARQNLAYARTLVPEWIRHDQSQSLIDSFFFWRAMLTCGEILIYGAAGFALAALFLAIGIAGGYSLARSLGYLMLLVWVLLILSSLWDTDSSPDHDVVITTETILHTANSENSASNFMKPLPSGAEATLIEQRNRWSEIGLPNGQTGWVLNTTIERIGG